MQRTVTWRDSGDENGDFFSARCPFCDEDSRLRYTSYGRTHDHPGGIEMGAEETCGHFVEWDERGECATFEGDDDVPLD